VVFDAKFAATPRRRCRVCGVSLPSTFFSLAKKGSRLCVCCHSDDTIRRYAAAEPPAEPPKEKRCTRCGIVKAREEFYSKRGNSDGLLSQCKPCGNLTRRESQASIAAVPAPAAALPPTRSCRGCSQEKPRAAFYSRPTNGDGLDNVCRECRAQYTSAHRAQQRAASRIALPLPPAPDPEPSAARWAPHHAFG